MVLCAVAGMALARPFLMLAVILAERYPTLAEWKQLWPGSSRVRADRGAIDLAFPDRLNPLSPFGVSQRRQTIVAATVALIVATAALRWGWSAEVVIGLALAAALLLISLIDLEHSRIPDRIVWPSLFASVVTFVVLAFARTESASLVAAATSAIAYFALLYVPFSISEQSMGFGDVKLALVLGLHLGFAAGEPLGGLVLTMVSLLIASLIGVAVGGVLYVVRRRSEPFPFGPALAVSTWVALLLSERILGA